MKIQEIVSDYRGRAETAGKQSQNVWAAYLGTQKKALDVVAKNGQSLAGTEIGAAKNLSAAARASFDQARKDGLRKVAGEPAAYVPNGRDQIVANYKDTIDLLVKTGSELSRIVSDGYKAIADANIAIVDTLIGKPAVPGEPAPAREASTRKTGGNAKSATSASKSSSARPDPTTTSVSSRKTSPAGREAARRRKPATGTSAKTGTAGAKRTAKRSATAGQTRPANPSQAGEGQAGRTKVRQGQASGPTAAE